MSAGALPPKRKLPDTPYAWELRVAARWPAIVVSFKIRYAGFAGRKGDEIRIPILGIRVDGYKGQEGRSLRVRSVGPPARDYKGLKQKWLLRFWVKSKAVKQVKQTRLKELNSGRN